MTHPLTLVQAALLSEYQLWPHGYVAVATLRASRRALEVLAVPHSFDALVAATGANAGHLQVALRTLRVLGWVTASDAQLAAATVAAGAAYAPASLTVTQPSTRKVRRATCRCPAFAPVAATTVAAGAAYAPASLTVTQPSTRKVRRATCNRVEVVM